MPVCTLESLERRIEAGDMNNGPPGPQSESNRHFIDIGFKTCVRWKILIIGDPSAIEFMTAMNYRMAPRPDSLLDAIIAFHYTPPFKIESNGMFTITFFHNHGKENLFVGPNSALFSSPGVSNIQSVTFPYIYSQSMF
jgi:hypothetical protein